MRQKLPCSNRKSSNARRLKKERWLKRLLASAPAIRRRRNFLLPFLQRAPSSSAHVHFANSKANQIIDSHFATPGHGQRGLSVETIDLIWQSPFKNPNKRAGRVPVTRLGRIIILRRKLLRDFLSQAQAYDFKKVSPSPLAKKFQNLR